MKNKIPCCNVKLTKFKKNGVVVITTAQLHSTKP